MLETKSVLTIYYSIRGYKEILEDSNIDECVEAFLQMKFSLNKIPNLPTLCKLGILKNRENWEKCDRI